MKREGSLTTNKQRKSKELGDIWDLKRSFEVSQYKGLSVVSLSHRKTNKNVPAKLHPHMIRHSRAMHLYRNGMPLSVLSEFLGHENPETTLIYAYADTEMKREAILKATSKHVFDVKETEMPIWDKNSDIIDRLIRGF